MSLVLFIFYVTSKTLNKFLKFLQTRREKHRWNIFFPSLSLIYQTWWKCFLVLLWGAMEKGAKNVEKMIYISRVISFSPSSQFDGFVFWIQYRAEDPSRNLEEKEQGTSNQLSKNQNFHHETLFWLTYSQEVEDLRPLGIL